MKTVLFDLDGTLIDTAPDFVFVVNKLRHDRGLSELPFTTIRQQVSNGARALTALGFGGEITNPNFDSDLQQLLDTYAHHLAVESHLFDGMEQCLSQLEANNIPWGVVTNKPEQFTTPLLERLGLTKRCSVSICPDHVTHKKPHAEPILAACEQLGIAPDHAVYVGDHIRDIESGNNAGSFTVAAGWGYLNVNDNPHLWQANEVFVDVTSFNHWVNQLLEKL